MPIDPHKHSDWVVLNKTFESHIERLRELKRSDIERRDVDAFISLLKKEFDLIMTEPGVEKDFWGWLASSDQAEFFDAQKVARKVLLKIIKKEERALEKSKRAENISRHEENLEVLKDAVRRQAESVYAAEIERVFNIDEEHLTKEDVKQFLTVAKQVFDSYSQPSSVSEAEEGLLLSGEVNLGIEFDVLEKLKARENHALLKSRRVASIEKRQKNIDFLYAFAACRRAKIYAGSKNPPPLVPLDVHRK